MSAWNPIELCGNILGHLNDKFSVNQKEKESNLKIKMSQRSDLFRRFKSDETWPKSPQELLVIKHQKVILKLGSCFISVVLVCKMVSRCFLDASNVIRLKCAITDSICGQLPNCVCQVNCLDEKAATRLFSQQAYQGLSIINYDS